MTTDRATAPPTLARSLGLLDAIVIGLGSMIGAGVFTVFATSAASAGTALLVGLPIAAMVALCNALASAQLAAVHPVAGGTYVYGREELGPWCGFAAGWCFVIGKTASCAAMAMTFAAYALPPGPWQRIGAVMAVVVLTAINCRGVTRTAAVTKVIVTIVLSVLAVLLAVGFAAQGTSWLAPIDEFRFQRSDLWGVLQAAGLIFFAFAGYARIATMGEEVRNPERSIPRAIIVSLAITTVVYAAIAWLLLSTLGAAGLTATTHPLIAAARHVGAGWLVVPLVIAASMAALGALLNLMTGIGRTTLAMARNDDMPAWLGAIHPIHKVPHRAEIVLGALIIVLILLTDLRWAIGFSSFGVLLYYAIANLSALKQSRARRYPRVLQVMGLIGCLVLAATLPFRSVVIGVMTLAVGLFVRFVVTGRRHS